jgi:hypothetical protein
MLSVPLVPIAAPERPLFGIPSPSSVSTEPGAIVDCVGTAYMLITCVAISALHVY